MIAMMTLPRYLSAELLMLRKRTSTRVLLGIWLTVGFFFSYLLPYLIYRGDASPDAPGATSELATLLPSGFVATMISGFPFYGGAIALMLGVISVGSEFGWGMWKTLFTQRPGRGTIFSVKSVALGLALIPFAVLIFAVGAGASAAIAWQEGEPIVWPGGLEIIQAVLAGWLILSVWAALGVLLAVSTRGTSLAIGVGILYALVIEGLISAFANRIDWLAPLIDGFLRANAYSLVRPLGGAAEGVGEGPGVFLGPFVGWEQAFLVLTGYLVVFLGASAWLMRRRDVA